MARDTDDAATLGADDTNLKVPSGEGTLLSRRNRCRVCESMIGAQIDDLFNLVVCCIWIMIPDF